MGTITASKGKAKTNRTIDSFVLVENMKLNETVDNQRIPETQRILFETTYANYLRPHHQLKVLLYASVLA